MHAVELYGVTAQTQPTAVDLELCSHCDRPSQLCSRLPPASYKVVQVNSTAFTATFWLHKQQILLSAQHFKVSEAVLHAVLGAAHTALLTVRALLTFNTLSLYTAAIFFPKVILCRWDMKQPFCAAACV